MIPLLCVLVALAVVGVQYMRGQGLKAEQLALAQDISRLNADIKIVSTRMGADVTVAVPAEPEEEGRFLDDVRAISALTGTTLLRWSASGATPATTAGTADDAAESTKIPSDIRELRGTIEISGPFDSAREFVRSVLTGQRLTTMSNVRWTRDEGGRTRLSCTLSRYVKESAIPMAVSAIDSGRNP